MVFCASRNIAQICVRNSLSGASSGMSTLDDDTQDAAEAEAREFTVVLDALLDTAAWPRADLADTRAGMMAV